MTSHYAELARSFEARRLDPHAFRHRDHVGVAYELLGRYDFLDATARYAAGIKALARQAGVPKKFNATITCAFLSLIAERMAATDYADCEDFIARNPDLLAKDLLARWYGPERLSSDLARQIFLLPETRP